MFVDWNITPRVRTSTDGRQIRYLPVSLRADGKLIALDEIIVGADQDWRVRGGGGPFFPPVFAIPLLR
jgi:hypothetical protein